MTINTADHVKQWCMSMSDLLNSFNEAQSRLVVQTADLPLGTLADMVEARAIDLKPGFQRRERWNIDKQSALIESFLLNVPVPPIYLAEEANGKFTAIDGKQRLKAINDYMLDRFSLRSLERLHAAIGVKFSELPEEIRNSLRLRPYLRVVTLLKQTDPLLKYEVFLRLNRAGEPLNQQEIRNVAFRGSFNDAVYAASLRPFLRTQLKIHGNSSSAFRDMVDAEYVLRFLTLFENFETFNGDLASTMDAYMRKRQGYSDPDSQRDVAEFDRAITRCEQLYGDHAFHRPDGAGWRDQLLAGMYDAQMIALAIFSDNDFQSLLNNQQTAINVTRDLFDDEEFNKSVKSGTNTPARFQYRVSALYSALVSVL